MENTDKSADAGSFAGHRALLESSPPAKTPAGRLLRGCAFTVALLMVLVVALGTPSPFGYAYAEGSSGAAGKKESVQTVAQKAPSGEQTREQEAGGEGSGAQQPTAPLSTTQGSVKINGKELAYSATAGYLTIKDASGKHKAEIFFVAYMCNEGAQTRKSQSARPVTFAFNGGPGASSVWLHLGAFGPKTIPVESEGRLSAAPQQLVDNPYTWLPFTDLVFIDPVGTGFSRAAPDEDPKEFWSVKEDLESVAEFIRLYCSKFDRWLAPKFIAGESYGGTRAAALASYLQERCNMLLQGVVLISPALNFQTIYFDPGNDLPYMVFLPAYTATAWYYKKLPPELQQCKLEEVLAESERFAATEYSVALARGSALSGEERSAVAGKLSRLTGLSKEFLERIDLRPDQPIFSKELLSSGGKSAARLDSRFAAINTNPAGCAPDFDPSLFYTAGVYGGAMEAYARRDLHFETDREYETLNSQVNASWNWRTSPSGQGYLYVADNLRDAMTKNQNLQVFIASGYFDLGTPYSATTYTVDHMGLDPSLRSNITMAFYPAGHQMYIHRPSHEKLCADAAAFYRKALENEEAP